MRGHDETATLFDVGNSRLRALIGAVAADYDTEHLLAGFQDLTNSWARRSLSEASRYRSNVADDGAPFEFSAAFSTSGFELQENVEPLAADPSVAHNALSARELLRELCERHDLCLERYRLVEELLLPQSPRGPFALWIGLSWMPGHPLRFKCYLSPQVHGEQATLDVMSAAMQRLGFGAAWNTVASGLSLADERRDEPAILCLDLAKSKNARVKVYVRHHRATLSDLDAAIAPARDYNRGDAPMFLGCLCDDAGPFRQKPPITELSFVDPTDTRPASWTLEFPLSSYVEDDLDASLRVQRCLIAFGIDPAPYERAIAAFATRPLVQGRGLHAHVTLRRIKGVGPRIAVYLASEAQRRMKGS
jgi:hypothetical protein